MFFESIINYVYPNLCGICGKRIIYNRFTCEICTSILKCYKERKFKSYDENIYYDYMLNLFEYRGIIKKQICKFKFNNEKYIGKTFSKILSKRILELNLNFDIIIPVPISKNRYKERGYNQSKILALQLVKDFKKRYYNNVLVKVKDNKRQSKLNLEARQSNVVGVYKIKNINLIKNKTILLIDDICTTGATVNECAKVLKLSGAKSVMVATIAYA